MIWMERAKTSRFACLAYPLFGAFVASGCASPVGGADPVAERPVTSLTTGVSGSGAVSQLDFFEALEQRSSVTWDELIAGVLLAAGKRTDGDYVDRLGVAKRAGILDAQLPPGSDALATPADLARVLLRAQGIRIRETLSDDEALALAERRSLVPPELRAADRLTGAVAVRALAAAGQPIRPADRVVPTRKNPPTNPPNGGSKP